MVRALVAVALCAACQGQPAGQAVGSAAPMPSSNVTDAELPSDTTAPLPDDAGDNPGAAADPEVRGKPDEPEQPDQGRVIAELGAIPAWQAVIDRAQLLGRRGQHGVVYGRVGPPVMVLAPAAVVPGGAASSGGAAPGGAAMAGGAVAVVTAGGVVPGGGTAVPGVGVASAGVGAPVPRGATAPAVGAMASGGAAAAPGAGVAPGVRAAAPAVAVGPGALRPAVPGVPIAAAAPPPADAGLVASPYVWLIDDTEGNGSLGIRIALGDKAKEGDRIAAGGAWQLDAERRWFWKPDAVQLLPPAPPSDVKEPPPPVPSHAIAAGSLPPGARTASVARDGDIVYFQIVGPPPVSDGDGWQIADQLGSPAVLVMNLPGEWPSYGGQDMRAADERWQLRRAQTYWVRIGKLHKHGDRPTQVNARTAPVRLQ